MCRPMISGHGGNFDPASLTGAVDGAYWAQVLNTRLGLPAGTIFQKRAIQLRRLCEYLTVRFSRWRDSQAAWSNSSLEYSAFHSRADSQRLPHHKLTATTAVRTRFRTINRGTR